MPSGRAAKRHCLCITSATAFALINSAPAQASPRPTLPSLAGMSTRKTEISIQTRGRRPCDIRCCLVNIGRDLPLAILLFVDQQ